MRYEKGIAKFTKNWRKQFLSHLWEPSTEEYVASLCGMLYEVRSSVGWDEDGKGPCKVCQWSLAKRTKFYEEGALPKARKLNRR